jgi:hypothetical protein
MPLVEDDEFNPLKVVFITKPRFLKLDGDIFTFTPKSHQNDLGQFSVRGEIIEDHTFSPLKVDFSFMITVFNLPPVFKS